MCGKITFSYFVIVSWKGSIILHDRIRPHESEVTIKKLNNLGYGVLPNPPYLLDLSPTAYHWFKHLNNFSKNVKFKTLEEMNSIVMTFKSDNFQKDIKIL